MAAGRRKCWDEIWATLISPGKVENQSLTESYTISNFQLQTVQGLDGLMFAVRLSLASIIPKLSSDQPTYVYNFDIFPEFCEEFDRSEKEERKQHFMLKYFCR